MKPEEREKQVQIVEAAIRRFSHFGIAKTTLAEIADDVSLSRQAFFYYYHDKNQLIAAVIRKMFHEFVDGVEQGFRSASTAAQAIFSILKTKDDFFKKYSLLALPDNKTEIVQSPDLKKIHTRGQKMMIAMLAAQLERGMESGEFRAMDATRTARLILDILTAYEHAAQHNKQGFVVAEDFSQLIRRQKEVLELLVAGLKNYPSI